MFSLCSVVSFVATCNIITNKCISIVSVHYIVQIAGELSIVKGSTVFRNLVIGAKVWSKNWLFKVKFFIWAGDEKILMFSVSIF